MTTTTEYLKTLPGACAAGRAWARKAHIKSDAEAWRQCHSFAWLCWLLGQRGLSMPDREARLFSCDCAERALANIAEPDPRSVAAVEVARRYADGKAGKAELAAAARAARAAARAARATAWAADAVWAADAAWAARATAWAADAAGAAGAAWAADAADAASWAAARAVRAADAAALDAARAAEDAWQAERARHYCPNLFTAREQGREP